MTQMVLKDNSYREKWQFAWQSTVFKRSFIAGSILLITLLSFFPFFFQLIERRNGIVLNDWLLNRIPARDVSSFIFIILGAAVITIIVRGVQNPDLLIQLIWASVLIYLLRTITLTLVALNPPVNLIPLDDTLSNLFYGKISVTKDLFFSGHTASIFLLSLLLRKKTDKLIALIATVVMIILLLIQHVHYTIDILGAIFFSYLTYLPIKKFVPQVEGRL
ncbi:MAG TPA: phosphatase PAP2-related protein [Puia sp.]|nr:phosphatase PAP2-related protein [Puia sp.]